MRVRASARGALCRRLGHTSADSRRSGRRLPPQGRALSYPDADDGLASARWRGPSAHTPGLRLEGGRPALSQSRDGQQSGQLQVSLHAGRRLHRAQPDLDAQELQPGGDYHQGLQGAARSRLEECEK